MTDRKWPPEPLGQRYADRSVRDDFNRLVREHNEMLAALLAVREDQESLGDHGDLALQVREAIARAEAPNE